MRNGDYMPTRMEAQNDAVNLIFASKTQQHPENTVGLMTMAGKGLRIFFSLLIRAMILFILFLNCC